VATLRQVSRTEPKTRGFPIRRAWLALGLTLLSASAGTALFRRHEQTRTARDRKSAEVRDLDERFELEKARFESKLQELKIRAARGFPVADVTSVEDLAKLVEPPGGAANVKASVVADSGNGVSESLRRSERAGRIESRTWEGYPSTIRFERVPGWNAYFVMERTHEPTKAESGLSIPELFFLGAGAVLGCLLIVLGLGGRKDPAPIAEEEVSNEAVPVAANAAFASPRPPAARVPIAPAVSRAPVIDVPASPARTPDSELDRFVSGRVARQRAYEEGRSARDRLLLETFDSELKGATPERLERTLADAVARAVGSPILFFRYDPRQGIALLTTEASAPGTRSLRSLVGQSGMSFALPPELIARIAEQESSGRKLSLQSHPPLARLMLARLGMANYEAWPMASASRLHGVLVITQSGVETLLRRGLVGALLDHAAARSAR
jgi:hypothetical protein